MAQVLASSGLTDVRDSLPIWEASAGMAPERFRALLVGKGLGMAAAGSLQAMARASSAGDVRAAGAHLAAALSGERERR